MRKSLLTLLLLAFVTLSYSQMTLFRSYEGNVEWSIDGVVGSQNPVGDLQVEVPEGSTIEEAFLYTGTAFGASPEVTLEGTTYSGSDWTFVGDIPIDGSAQVYRTDVTAQIKNLVGSGSATPFNFEVSEGPESLGSILGEGLVVVFSNPILPYSNITIFNGDVPVDPSEDNLTVSLTKMIDKDNPSFSACISAGISFSFQDLSATTMRSSIDVNGNPLTISAGGTEDGSTVASNTLLFTIGGIGDSKTNPSPTTFDITDDELYTIDDFLSDGSSSFDVTLSSNSDDEVFFFLGSKVVLREPTPIPTLSQWGIIVLGMLTMIFGVVALKDSIPLRLQGKQ